jgi:hypothetical protein
MSAAAGELVGCSGDDVTRNASVADAGAPDRSVADSFAPETSAPDTNAPDSLEPSTPDGMPLCPSPIFSPPDSVFPQNVVITAPGLPSSTDSPPGYIFYTKDGTLPSHKGPIYDAGTVGIQIVDYTTFQAISSTLGATCVDSPIVTAAYFAPPPKPDAGPPPAAPTFSPDGTMAAQNNDFQLQISSTTSSAIICYATGTAAPTCTSTVSGATCDQGSTTYTAPIDINAATAQTALGQVTVRAIACNSAGASSVTSLAYTLQAAVPTMSPAPGTSPSGTLCSFSDATNGATIYYTSDGTAPSCTPGGSVKTYSAPFALATGTYSAIACKAGYEPSTVAGPFAIVVQ